MGTMSAMLISGAFVSEVFCWEFLGGGSGERGGSRERMRARVLQRKTKPAFHFSLQFVDHITFKMFFHRLFTSYQRYTRKLSPFQNKCPRLREGKELNHRHRARKCGRDQGTHRPHLNAMLHDETSLSPLRLLLPCSLPAKASHSPSSF